jgi:hypothetical protein
MSNNTFQHVSNESKYVVFDPAGSNFPPGIINVQDALKTLSPIAVNGVPNASVASRGIIQIATQAEVDAGADNTKAVTPATLAVRMSRPEATETVLGLTQYATNAEAIAGTLNNRSIVATSLKAALDNAFTVRTSNESRLGVIKISSAAAAIAGVDDTTAMTPLKTKQAIANATALIPTYNPATESALGIVRLATSAQVLSGTLRDGYAISPAALAGVRASTTQFGLVRLATTTEAVGTSATVALTPAGLAARTGNTSRTGIVKLSATVGSGDANTALAYNANVVPLTGANMTGRLRLNGVDYITRNEIPEIVPVIPVGYICLNAANNIDTSGGIEWRRCDGASLNRITYSELFARIGYTYGGSGDNFNLPNFSNIFPRGASGSRPIGTRETDAMQNITGQFLADVASNGGIGRDLQGAFFDNGWSGLPADKGSINNPEVRRIGFNASRVVRTANETRPSNMAIWFMIRVK